MTAVAEIDGPLATLQLAPLPGLALESTRKLGTPDPASVAAEARVDADDPEHNGLAAPSSDTAAKTDMPRTFGCPDPCSPAPLLGVSATVAVVVGALELLIVAALRGVTIVAFRTVTTVTPCTPAEVRGDKLDDPDTNGVDGTTAAEIQTAAMGAIAGRLNGIAGGFRQYRSQY